MSQLKDALIKSIKGLAKISSGTGDIISSPPLVLEALSVKANKVADNIEGNTSSSSTLIAANAAIKAWKLNSYTKSLVKLKKLQEEMEKDIDTQ